MWQDLIKFHFLIVEAYLLGVRSIIFDNLSIFYLQPQAHHRYEDDVRTMEELFNQEGIEDDLV